MEKIIDIDRIPMVAKARKAVLGTRDYAKFNVMHESKNLLGRWVYIGWGELPYLLDGHIKSTKTGTYLYSRDNTERYLLTDDILNILEVS